MAPIPDPSNVFSDDGGRIARDYAKVFGKLSSNNTSRANNAIILYLRPLCDVGLFTNPDVIANMNSPFSVKIFARFVIKYKVRKLTAPYNDVVRKHAIVAN